MDYDFSYVIEKIRASPVVHEPFQHVHIEDLFLPEHFEAIRTSPEIASPPAASDAELIEHLAAVGYEVIHFPGALTDVAEYQRWHARKEYDDRFGGVCEGFGLVLRLGSIASPILRAVNDLILAEPFNRAIAEKFGVDFDACHFDGGIQKYLDGYEISPHPDVRKKASTFMVNINPSDASESMDHHTHYMRFRKERAYVEAFWKGNPDMERCWVPWDWAETVFQQTRNNSMVIFAPGDDTLHAVKSTYDHLVTQRTQLYGNLWLNESPVGGKLDWRDLDLRGAAQVAPAPVRKSLIARAVSKVKRSVLGSSMKVGTRNT